jgi:hypothetical protein
MKAISDLFVSFAWADIDSVRPIVAALRDEGLPVWFAETQIDNFESITRTVKEGLLHSKGLLAFYSRKYPERPACQWELRTAFTAAQLEGEPARRVLVVNPERDERGNPLCDHIHPIELRDAKFSMAPGSGDAEGCKRLAATVRRHLATIDGPFRELDPLGTPEWFSREKPILYGRFVGRFAEMWAVHSALHRSDTVLISGAAGADVAQLAGLGGIGKTLLARQYAVLFGPAYAGGVFWLRALGNDDSKAGMGPEAREAERQSQLRTFAASLGVPVEDRSPKEVEGALGREIARRGRACLWVADDLPSGLDAEGFGRWVSPHPLAKTLITTRSRTHCNLGSGKQTTLNLDVLPEADALALLIAHRKPVGEEEGGAARGIVQALGGHALAVDVAGAALAEREGRESFAEFLSQLSHRDKDSLDLAADLSDTLPTGHEPSIAGTILRSILLAGDPTKDFLRLASVLAVAPIPSTHVQEVFEEVDHLSKDAASERVDRALREAESLSLCERSEGRNGPRAVHTLVSRAVRFRDPLAERTGALRDAAVRALVSSLTPNVDDIRHHTDIQMEVVHGREVALQVNTVQGANLAGLVARYDIGRGAYRSAEALCRVSVKLQERLLGPERPDTLESTNNLAITFLLQGDSAGARKLEEQVLEGCLRVFGRKHPATLSAIST